MARGAECSVEVLFTCGLHDHDGEQSLTDHHQLLLRRRYRGGLRRLALRKTVGPRATPELSGA